MWDGSSGSVVVCSVTARRTEGACPFMRPRAAEGRPGDSASCSSTSCCRSFSGRCATGRGISTGPAARCMQQVPAQNATPPTETMAGHPATCIFWDDPPGEHLLKCALQSYSRRAPPVGIAALMLSRCRSRAAHSGPSRVPSRSSALMRVSNEASSPISLHQELGIK